MNRIPIALAFVSLFSSLFLPDLGLSPDLGASPVRDARGALRKGGFSRYGSALLQADRTLFEPGEPVLIRFQIVNRGYRMLRIYPSYEIARSFQFMVTDPTNREIKPLENPDVASERGKRVSDIHGDPVKEIILHPGESFVKTVNLRNYFHLKAGKEYRVVGYFYPDYRRRFFVLKGRNARIPYPDYQKISFVRTKNRIRIRIAEKRSAPTTYDHGTHTYQDNKSELSPEETVYLFLSAEMRRNWQNYLKYIDTRKFITSYDRYAARYAAASLARAPQVLRSFVRFLTGEPADRLVRFKVVSSDFERNSSGEIRGGARAMVRVRAERMSRGYRHSYDYHYTLERDRERRGFWRIVQVRAGAVR